MSYNSKEKNPHRRLKFRCFLYFTIVFYLFLYLLGDGVTLNIDLSELLMSIIIGNFACVITAVSIFAVFDYMDSKDKADGKAVLLTKENRIWFIDAILLALCNLIFSLVFGINNSHGLFFIVAISCYHTFMIFHYYLRERFNKNKESKTNNNEIEETEERNRTVKEIAVGILRTSIDATFLFVPAILLLVFDWKFNCSTTTMSIWFYILFGLYLLGCIAVKEVYLERKKIDKKKTS